MMGWSKAALCSIGVMFFSGAAWAEKIQCPTTLTEKNHVHRLHLVDVFEGPPEELASLLPDTDDEMIWTLSDSQNYAKAHHTAVFLECQYQGTAKKITLKVPASAKKCMAWFGNNKNDFYAGCE
ncbi:STY0301 family protein [Cronobacter sakazakii]|uniref:STY0301 family protein n=1 Tax=Cronobacter sakazakii TaxID=28141 RepID=UPI0015C5617E|nr:STY0301 family protein [Cronobacter sakazakii]